MPRSWLQMVPAKKRPSLSQPPSLKRVNGAFSELMGLLIWLILEFPVKTANPWAVVHANWNKVREFLVEPKERGWHLMHWILEPNMRWFHQKFPKRVLDWWYWHEKPGCHRWRKVTIWRLQKWVHLLFWNINEMQDRSGRIVNGTYCVWTLWAGKKKEQYDWKTYPRPRYNRPWARDAGQQVRVSRPLCGVCRGALVQQRLYVWKWPCLSSYRL